MEKLVRTLLAFALLATPAFAGEVFNILDATPVGAWQERETIATDDKGKKTLSTIRMSRLDDETRNGVDYAWLEMEIQSYKVKGSERKPEGQANIMKLLIKKSATSIDAENVLSNLTNFGEEIIIQNGDSDPMKLSGAGGLMGSMLSAFGSGIKFEFSPAGTESVTIPAGTFSCRKMVGKGSGEIKVIIKTIKIQSETETWYSSEVPFGAVKMSERSTVNGKATTSETVLLAHGSSGAKSKITKPVKEMPAMPGLFGN